MTGEGSRYRRVEVPEETREERASFGEILRSYSPEEAVLEAQRCLQCAMPFCVQACPITQDCRGYISLIAQRRFDDAARLTVIEMTPSKSGAPRGTMRTLGELFNQAGECVMTLRALSIIGARSR